jgi:hypothetical protein
LRKLGERSSLMPQRSSTSRASFNIVRSQDTHGHTDTVVWWWWWCCIPMVVVWWWHQ